MVRRTSEPWSAIDYLYVVAVAVTVLAILGLSYLLVRSGVTEIGYRGPPTAPPHHIGPASAVIRVTIADTNCCYIEGAMRFVELDGPTSGSWAVRESSEARVATGTYTLTAFEQVCSGSCAMLDPPKNHCEIELDLANGAVVDVLVTFPIPAPCSVEVRERPETGSVNQHHPPLVTLQSGA